MAVARASPLFGHAPVRTNPLGCHPPWADAAPAANAPRVPDIDQSELVSEWVLSSATNFFKHKDQHILPFNYPGFGSHGFVVFIPCRTTSSPNQISL